MSLAICQKIIVAVDRNPTNDLVYQDSPGLSINVKGLGLYTLTSKLSSHLSLC